MERVKGIEPSYEAWEAAVLPLNYTRMVCIVGEAASTQRVYLGAGLLAFFKQVTYCRCL